MAAYYNPLMEGSGVERDGGIDLEEYIVNHSPDPASEGGISIGLVGTGQSGKTSLLRLILLAIDQRTPGHGVLLMTNSPYSRSLQAVKDVMPDMAICPNGYDKTAMKGVNKEAATTARSSRESGDGELEEFYTVVLDDCLQGGKNSAPCIEAAMAGRNHGVSFIQTAHHFKHIDTGIRDHLNYVFILRMSGTEGKREVIGTLLKQYLQSSKLYSPDYASKFFDQVVSPSEDGSLRGGFMISQLTGEAYYMEYSIEEATLYPLLEEYETYVTEGWQ